MWYLLAAFILAAVLSLLLVKIMKRVGLVDNPDGVRKLHNNSVPLGGGVAIFLSFWLVVGYVVFFTNIFGRNLKPTDLVGVFIGSLMLLVLGLADDKWKLSAKVRLMVGILAVLAALIGGVGIDKITNPLGGVMPLDNWKINLGGLGTIFVIADLIVFLWIMGMTYTVKILDGLDGLSTGITAIGALIIYGVANGDRWHQPDMALLALIFAGACLGFLIFNFNPAKIFLGEGGGLFLGYILGVLSVISGGKFATALLVMAIPILDLVRVIIVRVRRGQPLYIGDREHLHFWLKDHGWSEKKTVLCLYVAAIGFGSLALIFQSGGKLAALLFLLVGMGIVALVIQRSEKTKALK